FVVTVIAVIFSLGGKFIPALEPISRVSWFAGVILAFVLYSLFKKDTTKVVENKVKATNDSDIGIKNPM
ncbi:hypothetical protein, partial [Winogradskyella poriferorum]